MSSGYVMQPVDLPTRYSVNTVFATVAVCGVATILQSVRAGRIGTGHLVVVAASAAVISVCISAVSAGGPALLATLVLVSSVVPLVLSARLASSVRHQQYRGMDVVTVRVAAPASDGDGEA